MDHTPGGEDPQPAPKRIVVLESAAAYSELLRCMAAEQGWWLGVEEEFNGFLASLAEQSVDLALVSFSDLNRGGSDPPAEALRRLGDGLSAPLLVTVTSSGEQREALGLGATSTIAKPYDAELIVLAITALIRPRLALGSILAEVAAVGDLTVSVANHTIERRGHKQVLSPTEWQLFAYLMGNPGRVFTRRDLARGAWGTAYADRLAQTELYVSRLRRKVERDPRNPQIIETVRGQGYRLRGHPTRTAAASVRNPGNERLIEGEAEDSNSPSVTSHWKRVYSQLVDAKGHLLAAARDQLDRLLPEVQHEIRQGDIATLEAELHRLQRRLDHWNDRFDADHAATASVPSGRATAAREYTGVWRG
jgi:DNA-binding response OmpR family regulator